MSSWRLLLAGLLVQGCGMFSSFDAQLDVRAALDGPCDETYTKVDLPVLSGKLQTPRKGIELHLGTEGATVQGKPVEQVDWTEVVETQRGDRILLGKNVSEQLVVFADKKVSPKVLISHLQQAHGAGLNRFVMVGFHDQPDRTITYVDPAYASELMGRLPKDDAGFQTELARELDTQLAGCEETKKEFAQAARASGEMRCQLAVDALARTLPCRAADNEKVITAFQILRARTPPQTGVLLVLDKTASPVVVPADATLSELYDLLRRQGKPGWLTLEEA